MSDMEISRKKQTDSNNQKLDGKSVTECDSLSRVWEYFALTTIERFT